jgi:hypothetical protein
LIAGEGLVLNSQAKVVGDVTTLTVLSKVLTQLVLENYGE